VLALLGFVVALGVLALLFFIVWVVKPDEIEFSAALKEIIKLTFSAKGRKRVEPAQEKIEPAQDSAHHDD
jgi:hypothetical protein